MEKLPNGSLILCCQKKIVFPSSKLLDLDVCSNDNKSFTAEASDIIIWCIKRYICQKAVDSLATFVALKALCNGILKLMGSQVTTEINGYKEV